LASALRAKGRLADAVTVHAEIDSTFRAIGGHDRRSVRNLRDWAGCLRRLGRAKEAEERLREAHDLSAAEFGEGSEDCTAIEHELAAVQAEIAQ